MKRVDLSLPEFMFIVATRAALGAGIGLLAAERLRRSQRRYVGATLVALGAITTIPAALALFARGPRTTTKPAIDAADPPGGRSMS